MIKCPQFLAAQLKILWMDQDEFVTVVFLLGLAMVFGGFFWPAVVIVPVIFSQLKKRFPNGFMVILFYLLGFVIFKGYPMSFQNEFWE